MKAAEVYINKIILPITPDSITYTYQDRTEEVATVEGDPVIITKLDGARGLSFEMRIPGTKAACDFTPLYPANEYVEYLENIKKNFRTVIITIIRPDGSSTNREMVLTNWQPVEAAPPLVMSIALEFKDWQTGMAYQIDPNTRMIMRNRTYKG